MKRLIKINMIYNAIEDYNPISKDNEYIEIFKNPTQKELDAARNGIEKNCVRLSITEHGDVYCWNGHILHESVFSKFIEAEGPICITDDNGTCSVELKYDITEYKQFKEIINNAICLTKLDIINMYCELYPQYPMSEEDMDHCEMIKQLNRV